MSERDLLFIVTGKSIDEALPYVRTYLDKNGDVKSLGIYREYECPVHLPDHSASKEDIDIYNSKALARARQEHPYAEPFSITLEDRAAVFVYPSFGRPIYCFAKTKEGVAIKEEICKGVTAWEIEPWSIE